MANLYTQEHDLENLMNTPLKKEPGMLQSPGKIPDLGMMKNLYRAPTGSVGQQGEPIYDVFLGSDHIKDPTDPRLKGLDINSLPMGQAPTGFQSQFLSPAEKLKNQGAVTTGQLPEEQFNAMDELKKRFTQTDDYVSKLMALYTPTDRESELQQQLDQMTTSAELGMAREEERDAPMALVTGRQAALEKQANIKLAGLQRELTRLTGNREGQQKAIETAYNIKNQDINTALAFYKATAPESVATDERTGTVYFRNPMTGEVTATKLPGFQAKPEDLNEVDLGNKVVLLDKTGNIIKSYPKGQSPGTATTGGTVNPGEDPQLYSGLSSPTATAVRSQVGAFKSEPIVQNFATIQEGRNFAQSMSNDTQNPADDQGLIYALAKALDPGSVVREGEYATAQKYSQSWISAYGKGVEQALAGTGFLSKTARQNIKKTIEQKYNASKKSYDNLYTQYSSGISTLTGRSDGTKFLRDYRIAEDQGGSSNVDSYLDSVTPNQAIAEPVNAYLKLLYGK